MLLLLLLFGIQLIISLIFSYAILHRLPPEYWKKQAGMILLNTAFGAFVPIFGIIGLAVIFLYLPRTVRKTIPVDIATLEAYLPQKHQIFTRLNIPEAIKKLKLPTTPLPERLKALLTLNAYKTPYTNKILHSLTSHADDEIRLISVGLLERQEKIIYDKIMTHSIGLQKDLSKNRHAKHAKWIALLYWELILRNVAHEDLHESLLETALEYTKQAEAALGNDPAIWLLYGHIYDRLSETEKAYEAFLKAQELGACYYLVLPFLAKHCFQRQDYRQLRHLLRSSPVLEDIPSMKPLVHFWNEQ